MQKGFVDLQCNGWRGVDFSAPDLTLEQIESVTRGLVARGTMAYCPTVVTAPLEVYESNLPLIVEAMKDAQLGCHILGIHLEGPFISPEPGAVGAHPKQSVLAPSMKVFEKLQKLARGNIKIITVAPELPGSEAFIRQVSKRGVVVSIGHHMASDEDMNRAARAGAKLCTHVGNGIPNLIHRHNNPLWWQLATDEVSGMFITDGHHLPADLITVALRAKTPRRFIVTSDASPLAGMPPGKYTIFTNLAVTIDPSGLIYSDQTKGMAGSYSTMLDCMNHLASLKLLNEKNLWLVGRDNQLRLLNKRFRLSKEAKIPKLEFKAGKFVLQRSPAS